MRPVASDVRTFPAHCVPSTILILPAISSLAHGVVVPIPTLPVSQIVNFESARVAEFAHRAGQFNKWILPAAFAHQPLLSVRSNTMADFLYNVLFSLYQKPSHAYCHTQIVFAPTETNVFAGVTTSSADCGVVVPIPTFPALLIRIVAPRVLHAG